jgi:hypothetical protein
MIFGVGVVAARLWPVGSFDFVLTPNMALENKTEVMNESLESLEDDTDEMVDLEQEFPIENGRIVAKIIYTGIDIEDLIQMENYLLEFREQLDSCHERKLFYPLQHLDHLQVIVEGKFEYKQVLNNTFGENQEYWIDNREKGLTELVHKISKNKEKCIAIKHKGAFIKMLKDVQLHADKYFEQLHKELTEDDESD